MAKDEAEIFNRIISRRAFFCCTNLIYMPGMPVTPSLFNLVLRSGFGTLGCQSEDAALPPDPVSPLETSTESTATTETEAEEMYGIIGKMTATEGKRDELISILLEGTAEMPGCQLYAIAADTADETSIWITEIWDSEDSHQASLTLPKVQDAIAKGKPMIAGFDERHIVTPIGGVGVTTGSHENE